MSLKIRVLVLATALLLAGFGQASARGACDSCPGSNCTLSSCNCDQGGGCCLCWYLCPGIGLCAWDDCSGLSEGCI